jgi:hypothetical protein
MAVIGVFSVACALARQPLLAFGSFALSALVGAVAVWESGLATAAVLAAVDASASDPLLRHHVDADESFEPDRPVLMTVEGENA